MVIDKFHISLFNIIKEIVYIYNFDTKEVLFLNNIGKQRLNINNNIPLKIEIENSIFFNNYESLNNENFEKESIISYNGYTYSLNKTLAYYEGGKVILCICNEIKYSTNKNLEKLDMNDILISSIATLSKDKEVFKIIYEVLEKVGLYYEADRCYIKEILSDKNNNVLYYKWENLNIRNNENCRDFFDEITLWDKYLGKDELVFIEDISILRKDWEGKYQEYLQRNIKNVIVCKMNIDDVCFGILCVENLESHLEEILIVKSLAYFIINELKRREISKKLNFMSLHDISTGLNNRNKYLNIINSIRYRNIQNLGLAFIDINGLKAINDSQGHEAGDRVIYEVSECLKRNFRKDDLYRIGGDEFVILSENISKNTFLDKIYSINRHFLKLKEYSISIGYIWVDKNIKIDDLIQKADQYMYEAKREYYKNKTENNNIYSSMATEDEKDTSKTKIILGKDINFNKTSNKEDIESKQEEFKYHIRKLGNDTEKIMVMLDINNFKAINEMYSYEIGNDILDSVSSIINSILGDSGICYHSYSDVYYFCAISEDDDKTKEILDKINFEINKEIKNIKITLSYGIYRMKSKEVIVEQAMERASYAHKISKKDNTKCITYYNDTLKANILKEKQIEDDMDKALETNQFKLYLQPKYNIYKNEIIGAEALVRWQHPEKGVISPASFIPVFEKNGFIVKLDMYILEEACKFIKENEKKGRKNVPISINISKLNFRRKNFKEYIMNVIKKYDVDPEYIELEITESLVAEEPEEITKVINEFKTERVSIAMDDFGTGYSSLSILQFLPIDVLKIDCGFFREFDKTKRGAAIIKAIVNLGKELELKVVAEGVEKKKEVDYLKEIGCETIQGYYYCKPITLEEFEEKAFGK